MYDIWIAIKIWSSHLEKRRNKLYRHSKRIWNNCIQKDCQYYRRLEEREEDKQIGWNGKAREGTRGNKNTEEKERAKDERESAEMGARAHCAATFNGRWWAQPPWNPESDCHPLPIPVVESQSLPLETRLGFLPFPPSPRKYHGH